MDVLSRIAIHGHNIRQLTLLDAADLITHPDEFRRIQGGALIASNAGMPASVI